MLVEICSSSIESVIMANKVNADRIELCSNMNIGGLTPSMGLIELALKESKIPIHCLIRPREGHFIYDKHEFKTIISDILKIRKLGVKGIVVGTITDDFEINTKQLDLIINKANGLDITFHRAFDLVKDPFEAMNKLIKLGFNRILSSGQKNNAELGIELLKELKNESIGQITIMPGEGINIKNCLLFKNEKFEAIHFSAWKPLLRNYVLNENEKIKTFDAEIGHSDRNIIEEIILKIKK